MEHKRILEFIELMKKTFGKYKRYSGGCYKFSLLLIYAFGGHMYWTSEHIITWINGRYYDINGEVTEGHQDYILVGGGDVSQEWVDEQYKEYV